MSATMNMNRSYGYFSQAEIEREELRRLLEQGRKESAMREREFGAMKSCLITKETLAAELQREKASMEALLRAMQIKLDSMQSNAEAMQAQLKTKARELEDKDSKADCFFGKRTKEGALSLYDSVVKGESIDQLFTTGWTYHENNPPPTYETLQICAIGNYNKGKSYFLNYLSGKESAAVGFHIHTEGVSVIFPTSEQEAILYMDTQGFEMPVLARESKGFEEVVQDCKITEEVFQQFIINSSQVILCVVGQLTFADQILIRKLTNDHVRNGAGKTLIIIHNLCMFRYVDDVKKAWANVMATFNLQKRDFLPNPAHAKRNQSYYVMKTETASAVDIRHYVIAHEDSEAGDFYNPPVRENLLAIFSTETKRSRFHVFQELAKFLKEWLPNYLENNDLVEEIQPADTPKGPSKIRFKDKPIFKPIKFDSFQRIVSQQEGISYEIVYNKQYLFVLVDFPGMPDQEIAERVKGKVTPLADGSITIQVTCNKIRNLIDTPASECDGLKVLASKSRAFGEFRVQLPTLKNDIEFKDVSKPMRRQGNGMLQLRWELKQGGRDIDI